MEDVNKLNCHRKSTEAPQGSGAVGLKPLNKASERWILPMALSSTIRLMSTLLKLKLGFFRVLSMCLCLHGHFLRKIWLGCSVTLGGVDGQIFRKHTF